jgi:DNA-binding LacI/PurR family transcriptional regulator
MANVRLIAQRAGVSPTTVSRVLNNHPRVSEAVRRRVVAATNETGYVSSVGRKSTSNIALLYTGESSLGSPFDAALMSGMSEDMEEVGYDLVVLNARRAKHVHESFTQMFVRKGVRGAVIRTTANTRGICEAIADEGFPCVVVGDRFEKPNVNYVYSDSREASREAVEHLIGLGHRRIAICVNVVDDSDHADRLAGYRQALADNGIEHDPRLVLRIPANRNGGAQLMRRMMTIPDRPTAAFLTDPMTVIGALGEARKMGVEIPRDLSIVGFDDWEMRYSVYPELTAVCQDAVLLGREAFKALNTLLEHTGGTEPFPVTQKAMRTWLEVHGTTAPPASAG